MSKVQEKAEFKAQNNPLSKRLKKLFLTAFGLIGLTYIIYPKIEEHNNEIKQYNKDYPWPQGSAFYLMSYQIVFLLICKFLMTKLSAPLNIYFLDKKYKNPDHTLSAEGERLKDKISYSLYKFLWNLLINYYTFQIFRNADYFPKELMGNGILSELYVKKHPHYNFYDRPENFDFIYIFNFSFYIFDLIILILTEDQPADYNELYYHHIATAVLIQYSFWTNNSNIGSIVLCLHNMGNIIIYFIRFTMYSSMPSGIKTSSGILLIVYWAYYRLYFFAKVIYTLYALEIVDIFKPSLMLFLIFLYILHISIFFEIGKKVLKYVYTGKTEDVKVKD